MNQGIGSSGRLDREQDFWDHHVPPLSECLTEYKHGPDPNTATMLAAVAPLDGARVLDFACGAGITSAWLAARGARVTGLDLSPGATKRAEELLKALGLKATFIAAPIETAPLDLAGFDAIVGRYALHHVDCASMGPLLASYLRPGGRAAFVETMATNPLLRFARKHVVGRLGVVRYGTLDEHPLTREDLEVLRHAFGKLELRVGQMTFMRVFDRQVLHYRMPTLSRLLNAVDDFMQLRLRLGSWSYHQVLVLTRLR